MAAIKEESEDVKIEEPFRVKHEDTEEQTDLKGECKVLNEIVEEEQYEKSLNEYGNLKIDMRIHSGKKRFTCQQCGNRFTQKGILSRHKRIHSGEKPFTCQQCGKSFSEHGSLKAHMRIHSGESPFICQQCGKGFIQKVSLNRHMKIHTGEKPFVCHQCGESFDKKGDLSYHMKIHTGEDPFTCQQCGKTFTLKGNLNRHMRNLHCIESTQSQLMRTRKRTGLYVISLHEHSRRRRTISFCLMQYKWFCHHTLKHPKCHAILVQYLYLL
ncbi:gastrula zinc finger protein XlCGF49.1 [Carassius gibelio]|uniref:gastrula zinc finger protein XlCGF49.1 n=1 Tax=Carassius gibelio TaxID=101364 RepID=UPI00227788EF|nr:gastrula zinc finger protein XlCGF49.1 [Carassius gibelio]XP_052407397.1 gastrula zinc finger protein XlCGF49.1 [Carassius gibelio]XP_052407398.1 gastrula zinc finger protein XlCGF49.1 [Carassius gibelio]